MESPNVMKRGGMNRFETVEVSGRKLTVYPPPSYKTSGERYPVVYVQDGGALFAECINYIELLFREGRLPEMLLVGIGTANRNADYTPWPSAALVPGFPDFGGNGRAYVDEVADVIKPYVDAHYRTKPDSLHTGIAGASFGGMIAMFAGYWRPDIFGSAGLLSASFWYDGVMEFIRSEPAPPEKLRIYMSVGSGEGKYKTNVQKNMVPSTLETNRLWLEKGFPPQRLRFEVEEGGTHDPVFMARRLPEALSFMLGDGSLGRRETASAARKPEADAVIGDHADASRGGNSRNADRISLGYAVPGTETFELTARETGGRYRIFVFRPAKPAPAGGYPVLYALDGNACFGSLAEAMRLQSRHPLGLEPGIIVGIGYDTDEPFATGRRFYDYTIAALPGDTRPDGTPFPETGGADRFLSFIEEELKPEIERRYPVDRARQALFGHSLGGFFTLYALLEQPGAFRSYIAGSPSVWWAGRYLPERLQDWVPGLKPGITDNLELLIAAGSEEKPFMTEDARQVYERLAPLASGGMRVVHELIAGEGHVSVIHPLISRMLRFVFAPRDRSKQQ